MSSSEFELDSVASESSYADYVERLRVKPASLPDVQHFNRPFDLGESHREFQGKPLSRGPSQPRVRHSFEPQSRARAIQIMRGELVDTLVDDKGASFAESAAEVGFKQTESEYESGVAAKTVELPPYSAVPSSKSLTYPETTTYTESRESGRVVHGHQEVHVMESTRPKPASSIREKFLREAVTLKDVATSETVEPYEEEFVEESLVTQYEKESEAERMETEDKLLEMRIRKWQQGGRMSEEETFHLETDLPMLAETQYMEPVGHIYPQEEEVEKRTTLETEAMPSSFHRSPRMTAKLVEPEPAIALAPKSPKAKAKGMKARSEETDAEAPLTLAHKSPRMRARAAEVEVELSSREQAMADDGLGESPWPRQVKSIKERFLTDVAKEPGEPYEEEGATESLRAQYEKSLEAERMQCEEKLLALRIRKWQQGVQMSEEETPCHEIDQPLLTETQYLEPKEHLYPDQQVVEEKIDRSARSTPKSPKVKGRVEQDETSASLVKTKLRTRPDEPETEASKMKTQVKEAETEPSPKVKADKMLFERTREERELQLSMENLSELKNETDKFVSEEEALTQRIMKWQQDVLLEQEQAVTLESDWTEDYAPTQAERSTDVERSITDSAASESVPQPKVPSPGRTAKEKFFLSEPVPVRFQHQEGDSLQWPPADDLQTEGRETRLQRDSEYFVSEEEALAQRILKWQQDGGEQEEVAELESEWALDNQCKQPDVGSPLESTVPPFESYPSHLPPSYKTLSGGTLPPRKSSPLPHPSGHEPTLPFDSTSSARRSPSHGLPPIERTGRETSPVQRYSPTTVPFEGYELSSARSESPHKPFRQISPVRRRSPCRSPQRDLQREEEESRQSMGEYAMTADKPSSQRFQSEVREERGVRQDAEITQESSRWKQSKDFASVRKEERPEIGAVKDKRSVEQGSDSKDSKMVKKGDTSAGGSRPMFVKEISSVKVKVGEMSEFTSQFQGDPLPTVTWLKDGHPIAHNPDYDIICKSNKSQLTVFYPTTHHEGTYDCVITNKHGKSICSATLEICDKKMKKSGVKQEVVVTEELEREEESQEDLIEEELQAYMDSGKATLQVPQMVIHRPRSLDESVSSSPVEIRVTAPTPVPELTEEGAEDRLLAEKTSDAPKDDGASQTVKHKFTFSFDVAGEAPCIVSELQAVTYSGGHTAVLECVIRGEPVPDVIWFYDNAPLKITADKYSVEVDGIVYRLYISSFTNADVGVYKCVARNKFGEVTSVADVSFKISDTVQFSEEGDAVEDGGFAPVGVTMDVEKQRSAAISHTDKSINQMKTVGSKDPSEVATRPKPKPGVAREPPTISGCGLTGSAAVIKISQIKQAFESDSPLSLPTSKSSEEQRKETLFPEEFIPAVAVTLDQQEQVVEPYTMHAVGGDGPTPAATVNPASPKLEPEATPSSGAVKVVSAESQDAPKRFVEGLQESPELVRPQPQKPVHSPGQVEAGEGETMTEETVRTFDRTGSFFSFQPEKVSTGKRIVRTSTSGKDTINPNITESLKSERQSAAPGSSSFHSEEEAISMEVPSYHEASSVREEVTEVREEGVEGYVFIPEMEALSKEAELPSEEEMISILEPSLDSGVFLSMPDSQADVTERAEEVVGDVVEPRVPLKSDNDVQPELLIVKPKMDTTSKQIDLPEDVAAEGTPLQDATAQERGSLDKASAPKAVGAAAAAGSMEEEEVTFGAVYDYYNPPSDWGRPLSPESEMSIEIGSTVSEEIADIAERFYTPGSSTEVSQPIAESFHTPKSFHTPSSDTASGFMTPQEYPFSPLELKRPSTGDSSERFFSPVQFLPSPGDEGGETTPAGIDESRFLTKGSGSLGLATLQEKVQGIPPAFLKPLIKKRVFENDSLTFCAEVFGLPSPEVKWFCNKSQLVADDRIKMDRDGDTITLTIHNVTKADQGEYICEAVNYVGEARSVALVVVVSQEVRFMPAPPAVTHQHVMEFDVEEDDSSRSPSPQEILLEVELDESEVKEFEKQVKIITIPEYTADNKSMIISLDVLPSIYEEGAVDFVTQEHDDLKIAFEVTEMPPRFINPICDMEAPEGTTVMFECSLMGIPSPIVSWFKGDKKIPHNNKKYLQSSDGDNHFMKICKVTTQDSGVYTCRAINVVGETLCRASLVVLNAKAFSGKTRGRELTAVNLGSAKVQPQKFDLMVGNPSFDGEQVSEIELEFEFEQEADESQRAVRLVANTDNETSEQGDKYVSINFDVFAEPAKDDKVEFKGKSSEMCSFQFQVTETAPKCVIPLTNVTAAVGTPVILQCLVSGKPNPTAEWFKDGERVTDSRCIIQEKTAGHFNLLITNVTQSDAGEYKCVIQNTAGGIETTALLKVF